MSTSDLGRRPTHAERARTIVASTTLGSLSTLAVDPAGYPFGSLVAYALDAEGQPVLCLSDLAEHVLNLRADPRASLMAAEAMGGDGADPLALGRVTLIGDLTTVADDEVADVRATYRAAHPEAFYVDFDDFHFFRLAVTSVRFVGGFGRMSWVDAAAYRSAEPDPIRPHAAGVLEHMNTDHPDALVVCAQAHGGLDGVTSARMVAVDRYGFDIEATTATGPQPVRVAFAEPMDIDRLQAEMVRITRAARAAVAG